MAKEELKERRDKLGYQDLEKMRYWKITPATLRHASPHNIHGCEAQVCIMPTRIFKLGEEVVTLYGRRRANARQMHKKCYERLLN